MIGLFGIGEILLTMEEGLAFKGKSARKINPKVVWQTWKELRCFAKYWATFAALHRDRLLDGHHARRRDARLVHELRHRAAHVEGPAVNFGKGEIEGVIAPETAAHAAGTAALLPMLTLGVPGSPTAAVLLGGLLIWGLQPGPMLFVEQKEFVWGLIASMYLGNIVGLIVVLTCVPLLAAILRIPFAVIAPVILVICAIGAYTVHSSMFDVVLMMVFGVVRLPLQEAASYPLAPHGAGPRARRHGRSELPPVDAAVAGQPLDLLGEPARRHHHRACDRPAAVAAVGRGEEYREGAREHAFRSLG